MEQQRQLQELVQDLAAKGVQAYPYGGKVIAPNLGAIKQTLVITPPPTAEGKWEISHKWGKTYWPNMAWASDHVKTWSTFGQVVNPTGKWAII